MFRFFTITLAVGLLVFACGDASAFPSFGGNCTSCHTNAGGDLTTSPDPLQVQIGDDGLLTFDITDLGGSDDTAISLSGLEDVLLDATIGAGGDNWTWQSGSSGSSYVSDFITSTGTYTLDLQIGSNAVLGDYGIGVDFVGHGARGSTFDFTVRVIPEPATLALAMLGICFTGFCGWRRRWNT